MTDSERIQVALKSVEQVVQAVESLNQKLHQEINARLEMALTIMQFVVRVKNHHNALARMVADSGLIGGDESKRCEFIGYIAQLESECERLENIIAKACDSATIEPSSQPSAGQ